MDTLITKENAQLISAAVALLAIFISIRKDRKQAEREYADKIRTAAATVIAKLERQKELSLYIFDAIQPAITEADSMLQDSCSSTTDEVPKKPNEIKAKTILTRDFFWKELVKVNTTVLESIIKEEIEIAYICLYGYLPEVHASFLLASNEITKLQEVMVKAIKIKTQEDILSFLNSSRPIESAELGNKIRDTCVDIRVACHAYMTQIIENFRNKMLILITASDTQILNKTVDEAVKNENHTTPKDLWENLHTTFIGPAPQPRQAVKPRKNTWSDDEYSISSGALICSNSATGPWYQSKSGQFNTDN